VYNLRLFVPHEPILLQNHLHTSHYVYLGLFLTTQHNFSTVAFVQELEQQELELE
jgi:hypothetical protein